MSSKLTVLTFPHADTLPVLSQSAALCYRIEKGKPRILLITTRRSRRWIIPKGWLNEGLTPSQSASREAWEEAGVVGLCERRPIGQFTYVKNRSGKGAAMVMVEVFPLYVQRVSTRYPESDERKRKWFSPKKASHRVPFPELAALLQGFGPKLN
ncbi:NUDIX hydrolase [Ruegeria sp. ANG-S4]|uniref:NUDIX hydrolase n=1 Tax=Ruegeria sp. ANG-S4 TaxID=1577904 RepID=UPI00057F1A33|nr:NUDIX hydrolase [Ruegeria sp. ANG-S4]KIC43776.1 NUDIX hydrolase [Ruegeria sp. ANG-S4]